MRKLLKVVFGIVFGAGILLALGGGALVLLGPPEYDVEVPILRVRRTEERIAQGKRLVTMTCKGCHYDTNEHSLAGSPMPDLDERLGRGHSANLTRDPEHGIGEWSEGDLAVALRTGVQPRTKHLMLPLMRRYPNMADADLEAIIAFLQSDDPLTRSSAKERPPTATTLWAEFFARTIWNPFAYPAEPVPLPDVDDPIAFGEYLVDSVFQCHACHSASLDDVDLLDADETPGYLGGGAKLSAMVGGQAVAANLTPHETGLADWTAEDLRRALVDGFHPDGTVLHWPMRRFHLLEQREVEAIYAYLRTVEPIDNEIELGHIRVVGPKNDAGLHVWQKYGCPYCHGPIGVGLVDMRGVDQRFSTDAALVAFLKAPSSVFPDTGMPAWDGIVEDADYPALCEISRRLSHEAEGRLGKRD